MGLTCFVRLEKMNVAESLCQFYFAWIMIPGIDLHSSPNESYI